MKVFTVTVSDEKAEYVRNILNDLSSIESVKESTSDENISNQAESALERIKKIQARIGNKELFKEITDPSEWQREIRKEWDRDF